MCLHPHDFSVVPEETERVARAVYRKGNPYLTLRDELGVIYRDERFASLFVSPRGRPAESPGNLSLVTAIQYAENLSDRQVTEAVRSRIDLKYLLGLELTDPGFDHTLLHEYRQRLLENEAEQKLLSVLLDLLRERKLLKKRGKQRTDSTHVLAAIRGLNRLEMVGETLRYALNSLATVAPAWLQPRVPREWFDLYSRRFEQWRLPETPAEREALAETIGQHGLELLEMASAEPSMPWLLEIPAVKTLQRVWQQQYKMGRSNLCWRKKNELPPANELIVSPYDEDSRFSAKRSTDWNGYKVHLTETCEDDLPALITNVETTFSTVPDVKMTEAIHGHLEEKDLLPKEHLVDAGYVDAQILADSQSQLGVNVIGPAPMNLSWQARTEGAYSLSCFEINWEAKQVTCPQGHLNADWHTTKGRRGAQVVHVRFRKRDCLHCSERAQCTRARHGPRTLTLHPKEQHLALQEARRRQTTPEFKEAYALRAGVEGTISQGVRRSGLRRSRYRGLPKTHQQHVFTAVAINLVRLANWFQGISRASTRCSRFAALAPA